MKRAICIKDGGNWVREGIRHRRYIPRRCGCTERQRERGGGEGEEARLRMITRESRDTIQEMHSVPRVDPSAAYEDSWPAHISIQIAIRAGPYLAATTALNRLPRS